MKNSLADDLKLIERLSTLFAVAFGILYVIGFLVVASHLSRYGVSSFSVLQLQYLVAGIWVLIPPAVLGAMDSAYRRFGQRWGPELLKKPDDWRTIWRTFIAMLVAYSPTILFIALSAIISNISAAMTWGMGVRLYLFFALIIVSFQTFWSSWRISKEQETSLVNRHAAPVYLSLFVLIVLFYGLWFSKRIYPLIPSSVGGGRPLNVAFIEGDKNFPDEIKKPEQSARRSIPYKLLLTTDKYYVVLSPNPKERSIEISRDAVAGMVVLE